MNEGEELDEVAVRRLGEASEQVAVGEDVSSMKEATSKMKKRTDLTDEGRLSLSADRCRASTELGDWRGETLGFGKSLIKQADPEVVEEWKWERGSGVVARRP